jgi:hypothetical protein
MKTYFRGSLAAIVLSASLFACATDIAETGAAPVPEGAPNTSATSTTYPQTFPVVGVPNKGGTIGTLTPLKSAEEFFGLTTPVASFTTVGKEDAEGASVAIELAEPMPPEFVTIQLVTTFFRPGIAASEAYEFALLGDQTILNSATITLPYQSVDDPDGRVENLWVAYKDDESGKWLPEEDSPWVDTAAGTVSVQTRHFGTHVVMRTQPVNGAWTAEFVGSMFDDSAEQEAEDMKKKF